MGVTKVYSKYMQGEICWWAVPRSSNFCFGQIVKSLLFCRKHYEHQNIWLTQYKSEFSKDTILNIYYSFRGEHCAGNLANVL